MSIDKYAMKSLEQLHINNIRNFYRSICEINVELAKIHKRITFDIDHKNYQFITDYMNQYVSYTSIWNVKFVSNLESPEIALLQIFHLEYIFEQENDNKFILERLTLSELKEKFHKLNAFSYEHIQLRKQKMLDYITNYPINQTSH